MDRKARKWSFLTHHTHVLVAVAHNPRLRLRDLAAACHITERTAQSIVNDLEDAGYLTREKDGRRRRYSLHLHGTHRHPAEAHLRLPELLALLTETAVPGTRLHSSAATTPPETHRSANQDGHGAAPD